MCDYRVTDNIQHTQLGILQSTHMHASMQNSQPRHWLAPVV